MLATWMARNAGNVVRINTGNVAGGDNNNNINFKTGIIGSAYLWMVREVSKRWSGCEETGRKNEGYGTKRLKRGENDRKNSI